jgi:hypothetical protein
MKDYDDDDHNNNNHHHHHFKTQITGFLILAKSLVLRLLYSLATSKP